MPDREATREAYREPLANTVMVTLANGSAASGYVPDDAALGRRSFQVLSSRPEPGCPEKAIVDGLSEMIQASR